MLRRALDLAAAAALALLVGVAVAGPASLLWLRYTTPEFDAASGECGPGPAPADRPASATLMLLWRDGNWYESETHPAAAPGARDSFRLAIAWAVDSAAVFVTDSAGNSSCWGRCAVPHPVTGVAPAALWIEARRDTGTFDLLGRKVRGQLRQGVYYRRIADGRVVRLVVVR